LYIRKIKEKKAGRALREELRKLPSVVRAGFMKMQALKAKTSSLQKDAVNPFRFY